VLPRFARRFLLVFAVLISFPSPLSYLPGLDDLSQWIDKLWAPLISWVGDHVLRLAEPITALPNGSGDTTFNYVELLVFATFAIAIAALWTSLDRRRDDARLVAWTRYYIALVLGLAMLLYGLDKVLLLQFDDLAPSDLARPLGRYTPFAMLWALVGWSHPYQLIVGCFEVLGGALVLFRPTVRVGALVLVPVLFNVVLFNLCFDVPVKLYSTQLLGLTAVLIAPDVRRLIDVIVLRRPPKPEVPDVPLLRASWAPRATFVCSALWLVVGTGSLIYSMTSTLAHRAEDADSPLIGSFRAVAATTGRQWRLVSIDSRTAMVIERDDGSVTAFSMKTDFAKHTLVLDAEHDAKWTLTYAQPAPAILVLDGAVEGEAIHLQLRRVDPRQQRLANWYVHAVHENVPEQDQLPDGE